MSIKTIVLCDIVSFLINDFMMSQVFDRDSFSVVFEPQTARWQCCVVMFVFYFDFAHKVVCSLYNQFSYNNF